ncbi:DUF1127 domain-containing protein [Pseudomonas aeruginosa]|nr:DUF1127 domain-containing protein [Pseudomonas aeruginosa]
MRFHTPPPSPGWEGTHDEDIPAPARREFQRSPGRPSTSRRPAGKLNSWRQNARSRKHLAQMSEHDLADLAISPSERYVEISKPFWR